MCVLNAERNTYSSSIKPKLLPHERIPKWETIVMGTVHFQRQLVFFLGNTYNICMWKFSRHIIQRAEERGYSREQILQIVNLEVNALIVKSPIDEEVDLYFGFVDSKYILVVADSKTKSLITARPMRDKE